MDRLMTLAIGKAASIPTTGSLLPFYGSPSVVVYMALNGDGVLAPGDASPNPGSSTQSGRKARSDLRTERGLAQVLGEEVQRALPG